MEKVNVIVDLSFEFALKIIEFSELLEGQRKYVIARQILRSGTSIGANVRESQSAESKADFIHKLKIADKELHETEYWLLLCQKSVSYPNPDKSLFDTVQSLKNVMSKIIITSRKRK